MLLAVLVGAIAAAFGVLRGGSLTNLAATRFTWIGLLVGGLGLQLLFQTWQPGWLSPRGALIATLASMAAVAGFLLANRRLPGSALAGLGLALNALVIAANGAMPVSSGAARTAGADLSLRDGGIKHERLEPDSKLPGLADVIPVPGAGVYSFGDVVLAVGIARLAYTRTRADEPRSDHSARRSAT